MNGQSGEDSLLNKMKKAKSFLDNVQKEKKVMRAQEIELAPPEPKREAPPKMPPAQSFLFSAAGVLYRKQESAWVEISPGQVQGKPLDGREIQILFVLDNTRIILNLRIIDPSHIKISHNTMVFTGLEEKNKIYTGCIKLKTEAEAAEIEKKLAQKVSPPGIEPGTSSV
ncbi:uncharacterized protein NEMAJ01_0927 [Nematocida major]|uniref:uncharacterized protein n=1 Tax=Nematocida major TaxID=1912982 RepID=UPI002007227E|nr:uncharacterized protein NEMAJ01_0927 [Nematocida major]KAH9386031.1 hypothetical protein NEMAJ01_0927 [Nematocida major]